MELAANATEGLKRLETSTYDLVLLDLMMPDKSGMEVLEEIRVRDRETPIFLITAYGSVEVAVTALKRGANDYFSKPWDNEKLLIEIDRMISKRRLERENTELKRALRQRYSFPNIVGKSERMLKILDLVGQVAASPRDHSHHRRNRHRQRTDRQRHPRATPSAPSIPSSRYTPARVPPDLLESALFGHVKGAFTGAVASRKGYFETANRGTIFFDEIGTISLETQTKLLRVIQEREFMPLGSTETIRVDVRIVAATNADLKKLVEEGRFREDLYYRLNVINLALPPLRDRKEDIPALVDHFFTKYCRENDKLLDEAGRSRLTFEPDAMQILMDHAWPGNVRELENVVERAVVLASQPPVPVDVLPEHLLESKGLRIRRDESGRLPSDASLFEIVADFERRKIIEQLEASDWSQTAAAEALRIPLSTLNQKIKRLNIDVRKRSGA